MHDVFVYWYYQLPHRVNLIYVTLLGNKNVHYFEIVWPFATGKRQPSCY